MAHLSQTVGLLNILYIESFTKKESWKSKLAVIVAADHQLHPLGQRQFINIL